MRALILVAAVGCSEPAPPAESGDAEADTAADSAIQEVTPAADTAGDACDPRPAEAYSIAACGTATCLVAGAKSIKLADGADVCAGNVIGPRVRDIGQHTGSPAHEVSVVHCAGGRLHLDVVDVDAGTVSASLLAPKGQKHAWTDALRDPIGKLHPFLAPSYGDANPVDPTYGAGATWGYGCVFDPSRTSDARCGAGFASFSTSPDGSWFREVGGYVRDIDGDGWEDPTFIFHQQVLTVSGKTGARLANLIYDVAAATEPSSPKWFHSGRNYGTHSAVTTGGELRVVEIGGAPVGTFTDYNCNVSRFLAVLSQAPLKLKWSRYVGFASTIFSKYEAAYAADPSVVVARRGDFVDGCIHRFSDSRVAIDGRPAILYNIFHGKPVATCLKEQYALYLGDPADADPEKRPWSPSKQKAWGDCQLANLKARGTWAMEALAEADGTSVTGGTGNYVWGWSSALVPGGETLYFVEQLPPEHRFDLSDVPPPKLEVRALVKGLWTRRGTFPVAGRPKIASVAGLGPRGVGAYTGFSELVIADADCDGAPELQLEDGTRVSWNGSTWAVKK